MQMADVMVHIDETVDPERRAKIADTVRAHKGVMAVAHHDEKPHLMIIEYDPDAVTSCVPRAVAIAGKVNEHVAISAGNNLATKIEKGLVV